MDQGQERSTTTLLLQKYDLTTFVEEGEDLSTLEKFARLFESVANEVDAKAMVSAFPTSVGMTPAERAQFLSENGQNLYRSPALTTETEGSESRDEQIAEIARHAVAICQRYIDMTPTDEAALSDEQRDIYEQIQGDTALFLEAAFIYATNSGENIAQKALYAKLGIEEGDDPSAPSRDRIRAGLLSSIQKYIHRVADKPDQVLKRIEELTNLNPFLMVRLLEEKSLGNDSDKIRRAISHFLDEWYNQPELEVLKAQELKTVVDTLKLYGCDVDTFYRINGFPAADALEERLDRFAELTEEDLQSVTNYFTDVNISEGVPYQYLYLTQLARRMTLLNAGEGTTEPSFPTLEMTRATFNNILGEVGVEMPILNLTTPRIYVSGDLSEFRSSNVAFTLQDGSQRQYTGCDIDMRLESSTKRHVVHESTHSVRRLIGQRLAERGTEGFEQIPLGVEEFFAMVAEDCSDTEIHSFPTPPQNQEFPYPDNLNIQAFKFSMSEALRFASQVPKERAIYYVLKALEQDSDLTEARVAELTDTVDEIYEEYFDRALIGIRVGKRSLSRDLSFPCDAIRYLFAGGNQSRGPLTTVASQALRERASESGLDGAPLKHRDMRAVFFSLMAYMAEDFNPGNWEAYLRNVSVEEAYGRLAQVGIEEDMV